MALLPPLFFEVVTCPLTTPVLPLYSVSASAGGDIGIAVHCPQLLKVPDHWLIIRQRHHAAFRLLSVPFLSDGASFDGARVIDG